MILLIFAASPQAKAILWERQHMTLYLRLASSGFCSFQTVVTTWFVDPWDQPTFPLCMRYRRFSDGGTLGGNFLRPEGLDSPATFGITLCFVGIGRLLKSARKIGGIKTFRCVLGLARPHGSACGGDRAYNSHKRFGQAVGIAPCPLRQRLLASQAFLLALVGPLIQSPATWSIKCGRVRFSGLVVLIAYRYCLPAELHIPRRSRAGYCSAKSLLGTGFGVILGSHAVRRRAPGHLNSSEWVAIIAGGTASEPHSNEGLQTASKLPSR